MEMYWTILTKLKTLKKSIIMHVSPYTSHLIQLQEAQFNELKEKMADLKDSKAVSIICFT